MASSKKKRSRTRDTSIVAALGAAAVLTAAACGPDDGELSPVSDDSGLQDAGVKVDGTTGADDAGADAAIGPDAGADAAMAIDATIGATVDAGTDARDGATAGDAGTDARDATTDADDASSDVLDAASDGTVFDLDGEADGDSSAVNDAGDGGTDGGTDSGGADAETS